MENIEISDLIGKTVSKIDKSDNVIDFYTESGGHYQMYHIQDCCEGVYVEDIIGDLNDLIGSPILKASEDTNSETNPDGVVKEYQESFTWTFYNLATIKGYVTIRWYGGSNGYYSERVDFVKF